MEDAQDDPAHRRPPGEAAGPGSVRAGSGVSDVGGRGKPRIEVLRAGPTAAAEPGFTSATREPRIEVLGGDSQDFAHSDSTGMPPEQPVAGDTLASRTGRRRFRAPTLLEWLLLLLLLALASLFVLPLFQSEGEDPPGREVVAGSTRDEVPDDGRVDEEPPPVEEPAVEQSTADAALSSELFSPEAGEAAPPIASPSPQPREAPVPRVGEPPARASEAPAQEARPPSPPAEEANTPTVSAAEETSALTTPVEGDGALATVRAFYDALSAGNGASAAQLVIPAKRQGGPLSAGQLTRYYSAFRRPLRVVRATPVDADTINVVYDYVLADGRLCEGQSLVDVVQGGDRTLIRGIRARGPC